MAKSTSPIPASNQKKATKVEMEIGEVKIEIQDNFSSPLIKITPASGVVFRIEVVTDGELRISTQSSTIAATPGGGRNVMHLRDLKE